MCHKANNAVSFGDYTVSNSEFMPDTASALKTFKRLREGFPSIIIESQLAEAEILTKVSPNMSHVC